MQERAGEATLLGTPLTLIGPRLRRGDTAPDFSLVAFDAETFQMTPIGLADLRGRTALLSVVISLDTPICQQETRDWEHQAARLPDLSLITVSKDLPFAQARWKRDEGVGHLTLSAYRDEQFGIDYGVLIKELHLLSRAVFVIDPAGRLAHVEYVKEQSDTPDFQAALDAAASVSPG